MRFWWAPWFLAAATCYGAPSILIIENAGRLDGGFCPGVLARIRGFALTGPAGTATTVTIGGKPGALIATVSSEELVVQLPTDLAPGDAAATVKVGADTSTPFNLKIDSYAPTFFSPSSGGVFFRDPASQSLFSISRPAVPGREVDTFLIGLGATNPAMSAGEAVTVQTPTAVPPQLTVGGIVASVTFAGLLPGSPGVYQVRFRVPLEVRAGYQDVLVSMGPVQSTKALLPTTTLLPVLRGVTNAGSGKKKEDLDLVAPNSYLSIFVRGIGTEDSGVMQPATSFQGVSVKFDGRAAVLQSVTPSKEQINVVVPGDLPPVGQSIITVTNPFGTSEGLTVTLTPNDIGLFRQFDPAYPTRGGVAANFPGSVGVVIPSSFASALSLSSCSNSPADEPCGRPARPGEMVSIYFTGGGKAVDTVTGEVLPGNQTAPSDGSAIYRTDASPQVRVGGVDAQVLFSGVVPGFSALYQINVVIPASAAFGDDVPFTLSMSGSDDTGTLAVQR